MGLALFNETYPLLETALITATTGTTVIDLGPVQAFPTRLDSVLVTNTAATDVVLNVYLYYQTLQAFVGAVTIPALAGRGVIPIFDLVAAMFNGPNGALVLPVGAKLQGGAGAALTGGDALAITLLGGFL